MPPRSRLLSLEPPLLFGTELECLTYVARSSGSAPAGDHMSALADLIEELRALAPSLPGPSGIFNGYGRVYMDCGHIELASCECDSPELLVSVIERQQELLVRATQRLRERGLELHLACNNHDGLLRANGRTWGSHENYLVNLPPKNLPATLMPFLVSRFYGGAGGLCYPSARYVASVRAEFMERDVGGNTTSQRAIHSTSREEHHVGGALPFYRYHLILGDGHRSHFNLALQFGATALCLRAIQFDRRLPRLLARLGLPLGGSWLATLRELNTLSHAGEAPEVPTLALVLQRLYHECCSRWVDALAEPPDWAAATLEAWGRCLDAVQDRDRDWLSARLDAFAKFELFEAALAGEGRSWSDLPNDRVPFDELTQLDQDYHDFTKADSPFALAEEAGLLEHRLGARIAAGSEEIPFVPSTSTRAHARARFLGEHDSRAEPKGGRAGLLMSWAAVTDPASGRVAELYHPFAEEYSEWRGHAPPPEDSMSAILARMRERRAAEGDEGL